MPTSHSLFVVSIQNEDETFSVAGVFFSVREAQSYGHHHKWKRARFLIEELGYDTVSSGFIDRPLKMPNF